MVPIGFVAAITTTSGFLKSHPTIVRPPDGRRSTETATTSIQNSATEHGTTRKKKRLLTAFELPSLIRPQPLRPRRRPRATAIQPFYSAIVAYIFSSRYVTASQVFRRFPEWLKTERTTQRHLANMVDHGLIAVASTRGTSPNFPFAYFATQRGISFVKGQIPGGENLQVPATEERRTRGQSLHSILHELFVSEFALMLDITARNRGDLQILSQERRYFRSDRRLTYRSNGETRRIEPDFGFLPAVTRESGERNILPLHFLEMELGTHRVLSLRDKLIAYDRWAGTESKEYVESVCARHGVQKTNTGNFRLLLVACDPYGGLGDTRRLLDLFVQIFELPPRMRERIWLCRGADLKAHSQDSTPLDAQIWYRAKDVKHWLSQYRSLFNRRSEQDQRGRVRYIRQRKFVAEKLPALRRHVLFPHLIAA